MTIKVDLLPTEKKQFGIDPAMILMFLLIIGSAVAMLLYSNSLTAQIEEQRAEIEKINAEIKQIETQLPLIEETKNRIASLKREIKMIKSLVYDPLRYANLLQEVAILLPENVWLDDLAIDPRGNKVSFTGSAAEVPGERKPLATIADLMRNFNDSEYFTNSTLSSTSEKGNEVPSVWGFKLTISYDPEKAATQPPTGMGQGSVPQVKASATPAPSGDEEESATPGDSSTPSATATP
jgi:Tfp pilus assembly protein PilN